MYIKIECVYQMQTMCGVGAKIDLSASETIHKIEEEDHCYTGDLETVISAVGSVEGEGFLERGSDVGSLASSTQVYQDMQDLIESWGSVSVSPQCVKDLNNFLQGQSESVKGKHMEHGLCWLQQKLSGDETLSIRDLAVFVLLHNQSLLLLQHENNEAVSFDISQSLDMVSKVSGCNQQKQEEEIANFEKELAALCVNE